MHARIVTHNQYTTQPTGFWKNDSVGREDGYGKTVIIKKAPTPEYRGFDGYLISS
jgi:hypothetical protein